MAGDYSLGARVLPSTAGEMQTRHRVTVLTELALMRAVPKGCVHSSL